jgi:hypothetical protein
MTWEVSIPVQSRSQEIGEVLALDRYVEDRQERLIVSHLLIESAFEGVHTVDDLLRLAPERKRALLDRARVAAGLKTIKEEELQLAKEAQFRASAAMPFTDEEGRRLQTCSASDCKAFPTDEVGALEAGSRPQVLVRSPPRSGGTGRRSATGAPLRPQSQLPPGAGR